MNFSWNEEELQFRGRVRQFLKQCWDNTANERRMGDARRFEKQLAEHGWLTMVWPEAYGGRNARHIEQMIFREEATLHDAPTDGMGPSMIDPCLIVHSTQKRKNEHLPPIAAGESRWCQRFPEPGSGSDLASLQARAVRDGDDWVINGQKIWTSVAQHSSWIHILTRTDPDAPKHRGISYFMLDMKAPGISIRPIEQMHGARGFNETFFEDVRVPHKNMIGDENRGWYAATTTLDFERSGAHRAAAVQRAFDRNLNYARQDDGAADEHRIIDNSQHRFAFVDTHIEIDIGRTLGYRVGWMQGNGLVLNYEAPISKTFNSELTQCQAGRAINMFGLYWGLVAESIRARATLITR
jgi:alkylation response protein AidB-like acyl-CoA dehydrogenase